jgi:hypothetical protein
MSRDGGARRVREPAAGLDRNHCLNYRLLRSQSYRRMKIGLIIASYGRPELVRQLLSTIERQARVPDQIVVSVVTEKDFEAGSATNPKVDVVYSSPGLCAQRNKGLGFLQDRVDVVLFIDDDFWMSETYIAELERIFSTNEDIVAVTGLCWRMERPPKASRSQKQTDILQTMCPHRPARCGTCPPPTGATWHFAPVKFAI